MTAQTPGQAEQDRAALIAWAEANDYTHQDTYEMADMDGAFMSGMQAARDLAAQERPAPDARRALLDIIAEIDQLDEPGPTADYIRMLAEYGLGEAAHPDGSSSAAPQPAPVKPDLADVERLVGEALGEASMCWEPLPEGVFDSTHAGRIIDRLMGAIRGLTRPFPDEGRPAPELAAAVRFAETTLDLLDDFTHAVIDSIPGTRIENAAKSVREKAGLPPVEG